jgi:hypothetical protein
LDQHRQARGCVTTSGTANLPNPVIAVTRKLSFDLYTDKTIGVAVGVRETATRRYRHRGQWRHHAGRDRICRRDQRGRRSTPSHPRRHASNWMTLTFDFRMNPSAISPAAMACFPQPPALGVLEHLAFVPAAGSGAYNVYLDNFIVATPKVLTYSLSNAPAGATINANERRVRLDANGNPRAGRLRHHCARDGQQPAARQRCKTFPGHGHRIQSSPVLAAITNRIVHAGTLVLFTNSATDADLPANILSFSLDVGAPALAGIGTSSGVFNWQTSDGNIGSTNNITVRVTDSGTPPLSDAKPFSIAVLARPSIVDASVSGGDFALTWTAIPGQKYRVQFKNDLNDANWSDLVPDVTASLSSAYKSDPLSATQRFYRVLVVTP